MELRAMPWHESVIEAELSKTKVLINAAATADAATVSPIDAQMLPPELLVLDLLYVPAETQLLRDARSAGATATMNGDLMLLHQTAAAFELWTGRKPELDMLRAKLDEVRGGTDAAQVPVEQATAAD
jgi:shikimate dehydrogenase